MAVSYDEMSTKKKSVSVTTTTPAVSAWDAMGDPNADKAVVRAQLSMPKANPKIGKTVGANDFKKLVSVPTTKSTPLMSALSTGKTDNVKANSGTAYKPLAVPTSAQKMANVGIDFKPTAQSQINTINGISNKTITPTPMVQDKQTDTDVERGFYALGGALAGDNANTVLGGLRYDLARGLGGVIGGGAGLVTQASGLVNQGLSALTSLGGTAPNAVSKWFDEGAKYALDRDVSGAMSAGIENSVEGKKNWSSNITGNLYETVGNIMTGKAAGGAISGFTKLAPEVASKLAMGLSAGGQGATNAYNEGATPQQAISFGNAVAGLEMATESMFGGVPGLGKGVFDDIIKGLKKSPTALKALVDMVGEGGEEVLSSFLTPYLQRILYNPEAKNATINELLTSFAYGAGLSGLMQAPSVIGSIGAKPSVSSTNNQYTAQTGTNNVQKQTLTPNLNANIPNVNVTNNVSVPNTVQNAGQITPNIVKPTQNIAQDTPQAPTANESTKEVKLPTNEENAVQRQQTKPEQKTPQENQIYIDERDYKNVSPRKVKAFQFDNPELHENYAQAAKGLLQDLSTSTKGERWALKDEDGYFVGSDGVKRSVSKPIEKLLDNADLSRNQITKALNDIIADHGQENYAAAKKVELILDEMLTDGFEVEGNYIEPDFDYIAKKEAIKNNTDYRMTEEEWNAIMSTEPQETAVSNPLSPSNPLGAKITKGMPEGTGAAAQGFDKLGAMVDKYGAIPEGENPHSAERVTEERIPKQTADDNLVSQTARTAYEAPLTTNEVAEKIEEAVLSDLFSYKKLTDKAALDYADKILAEKGYDNALSDWREDIHDGKVGKKLTAIGWKLYNEAGKAGKGQQAVEILIDISRSTRNGAQATQAVSLLKKMSPEYQLYAVQRSVQRMNDDMSRDNEKQQDKISGAERRKADVAAEKMAEVVNEESAKAANDVVDEIAKTTKKQGKKSDVKKPQNLNPLAKKTDAEKAAEKLANKVDSTTKERKAPEVNAINDMVNELFKSAKESPLPEQTPRPKRSPIEFLTQAIANKAEYTDVWNGAKDILLEKYSDNPEVLDMLNDYFEKGIVPTYSDATLTGSVKQMLKDLGIKLSQMKELTWENRQRVIKSLTNYLVEQTGAADGDAKMLKRDAADKITKLIIDSAPKLTKKQKLEIKQATQDAMRKHGVPVETWADETGRLISEGIAKTLEPQSTPKDKAMTQIITDDIKKFVGTIPKPIKTVVGRNAIDRYTDFMENRQYYTTAWEKLQSELKAKYANNPEALKAIDNIINRDADTAAKDYYDKQLDSMINKALKSINVKLSELVTQGKASKDASIKAVTDILINESGIDSETAKTVSENITDRFNEMLKERSAKRLSAMFPSNKNDIAEKRSLANKLESLINVGAFDSKAFNSIAAERVLGIKEVTISPKLADAFVQAKTEEARAEALDNIYRDVAAQVPATFKDKFDAWRYTAMLFNPITHIKNTGGNYAFAGERSVKSVISASVQTGANTIAHNLGGKGFEQTRAIALTKADKALIMDADTDYTKFSEEIYKVGKFDDVKSKINDYRTIFGRGGKTAVGNFLSKTVGVGVEKARTTNSSVLDIEDTWVSRPAYVNALAGYLKANKVNFQTADPALLERARSFAIDEARKAAYRDFNAFSNWVSTVGRGRAKNAFTKVVQMESEGILPFRRTLANMFVRAGEYSPIGLAKTITYDSYRLARGEIEPAEYIDNMAEGLTGTSLVALGMFLGAQGILTYGTSGDDKEDKLHETQGKQHFSINVAGKSYTVDWLAPFIVPIFMGVAINNLVTDTKDDGVKFDDVLKIATDITDPILELSMMSSLNDYIEGFSAAKQQDQNLIWYGVTQGALGYLGQAVPTIGGRIARTIDPTRRTSFTDPTNGIPDDIEYFAQTQLGKIPFVASTKQPYVDQWGRTQENGSFVGRFAQNFLSPGYLKDVNVSPMEKEIERLYEDYGKENEVNVLPPVSVKKYFSNNGESVYMTADEYTQYKKTSGQTAYSELTKLTNSAEYKAMTDAEKAEAVSDIYSQSAEKAKTQVMENRGDIRIPNSDAAKRIQYYVEAGVAEKKAAEINKAISELTPMEGESRVSVYQKVQTINNQGLTPKQQAAIVGTLYTSHDDNGNITDESLLPYISNSARLLSLYTQSKGENTAMINMTIPKSFSKSNVEYELTDAEKKLYKDTYIKEFNAHITSLSTEANVEHWSDIAATKAKNAVINGR